ncbi:MAG: T9SS type A sorting domain-containing protein [Ignavibacteriales bacterium]|nr:T9SS type A sorting domain-containing protein [Ignavibacteriales bacterium]
MNKHLYYIKLLAIPVLFLFGGWGKVAHQKINYNAAQYFPKEMNGFENWKDYLSEHASDADNRKGSDPTEGIKHYIDIDSYSEFVTNGFISQNLDSMVMLHGAAYVNDQGILPWATITTFDSLKKCFSRKDWNRAKFFAADLGHYVGDGHMPLHITKNYNPGGLHSRYESNLMSRYADQIIFNTDSIGYVSNTSDFIFHYIYSNYSYVDSVIQSDINSKSTAGNTNSDLYYSTLWSQTKNFTSDLLNHAAKNLAVLIYSAWVEAGKPQIVTQVKDERGSSNFRLFQNYPNPFNPSTEIGFQLASFSTVTLKIFNVLGTEVATLVNEDKPAGNYEVVFNTSRSEVTSHLTSGIYFYKLTAGSYSTTKKMMVMK